MEKIKRSHYIYILLFLSFAFCLILICRYPVVPHVPVYEKEAASFNEGWYYYSGKTRIPVKLPATVPHTNTGADIYRILPAIISPDACIGLLSSHQDVSCLIRDPFENPETSFSLFYDCHLSGAPLWLKTCHRFLNVIQLPPDAGGKEICIHTEAGALSRAGKYDVMTYGSKYAIVQGFAANNRPKLFFALTITIIGCIMLIVFFLFRLQFAEDHRIVYLSTITILTGLWLSEDSDMLQLYFNNPIIHWGLEYLLLMIMPLALIVFINSLDSKRNDIVFRILFDIDLVVISVQLILQFTGKYQLTESMIGTHLMLSIASLYSIFFLARGFRHGNHWIRNTLIASIMLGGGIVVQIINYYWSSNASSVPLNIGLLCFFLFLAIQFYRLMLKKIGQLNRLDDYKKLAFIDFATGLNSRTAYFTFVEKFIPPSGRNDAYTLILFDMNNLKQINDHYGHLTGDSVIRKFAESALSAFQEDGTLYRVGGDEFVGLFKNVSQEKIDRELSNFDNIVASQQYEEHPFTVAYGMTHFTPQKPSDFYDAQATADAQMYTMKQKMKAER